MFADISDHDCDILTEEIQKFINDHTKALSCQYISMAEVPIWKQSMLLQDFIAAYDSWEKYNMSEIKFCITGGSGFIGTTAMSWAISKYKAINFDIRPPKIL